MTGAWMTVGLALAGCLAGAVVGWAVGRSLRGQPLNALFAVLLAFAGGCYVAWKAAESGDVRLSAGGLGAAFGLMTAVKYSSGLIPGLGAPAGMPAARAAEVAEEDPSVEEQG